MTAQPSRLSLFRQRDFCVFWTGSFLSSMGTQFTTVAMAWQIYELTNSPMQIGLLGLARALPQFVLLLVGGLLYSLGAFVYAARRPDPVPAVFGYHEVFHVLVVVAAAAHYVAVAMTILS